MEPAEVQALLLDVQKYAAEHGGKIYAPVDHPAFAGIPYHHGPERFEPIALNMPSGVFTALDIGTHWGYFAHRLEGLGLRVTAAEHLPAYLDFLYRIRSLYGDTFEIFPESIFEMPRPVRFDVILGLNIFHHFLKTEQAFDQFTEFLNQIECQALFFQGHNTAEGQMKNSYRNFDPDEFCRFLVAQVPTLTDYREIARFGSRPMFLLT